MDATHEVMSERLAEVRELATAAKVDVELREALIMELGGIGQQVSKQIESWLALEEEAGDLLDLLTLFYQDDLSDTATVAPASPEVGVDEPFSNLLEPNPHDPLASTLRKGMAFFDLWLFGEAAETLAHVVRMEPGNFVAKLFLFASETARGRFQAALPLLADLTTQSTDEMLHAAAHEIAAQGYFAQNQITEAISHLQDVIATMPDYPDTWYNLGVCYHRRQDPIGAVGALSQALSLQPDDIEARMLLADVQMQLSEYTLAHDTVAEGLEYHPLHVGLVLSMARILSKCDRTAESLRWYRKATQVSPENHAAWSGYAGVLLRLRRRDEAIASLKKHLCLRPNHPDGLTQLAVLQSLRGDELDDRYLGILQGRDHRAATHLAQGRIALQQGQVKRALTSFQSALQGRAQPAVHRLARYYQDSIRTSQNHSE